MSSSKLRRDALAIFQAALAEVEAGAAVRSAWRNIRKTIKLQDYDRVYLVAAGKAAVEMAATVQQLAGRRLTTGIVVTKHGHAKQSIARCAIHEAGHPVPDAAGLAAVRQIEKLLRDTQCARPVNRGAFGRRISTFERAGSGFVATLTSSGQRSYCCVQERIFVS